MSGVCSELCEEGSINELRGELHNRSNIMEDSTEVREVGMGSSFQKLHSPTDNNSHIYMLVCVCVYGSVLVCICVYESVLVCICVYESVLACVCVYLCV
jgi:hypothetical protein